MSDSSEQTRRFRIGCVPFGVGRPLAEGIDPEKAEVIYERPSRLVELLREGAVDAALVSSIEGFRRPGYRALPDIGIACDGDVGSVRAFKRKGVDVIRTVGLDAASETSVALLKVLLANGRFGAVDGPEFVRVEPTTEPDALPQDLVLLIGDAGQHARSEERESLDLGGLWKEWTGLPFVFALWLIRPGVDAEGIAGLLRAAREVASMPPDETGVVFDLWPEALDGLQAYRNSAVALQLCRVELKPNWTDRP